MGWIGGQRATQTQTQTPQVPQWLTNEVQGNFLLANQLAQTPFEAYGGQRFAAPNADQQAGWQMARSNAGSWQPGLGAAEALTMAGAGGGPQSVAAQGLQGMDAQAYQARAFSAREFADAYRDPYENDVVAASLGDLQRQGDMAQRNLALQQAGSGGFSGSRAGFQAAQMQRDLIDRMGATASGLRSQGFGQRMALGSQDAGRFQDASFSNANARNALQSQQLGRMDAGAARDLQAQLANAGFAEQFRARLSGAGAQMAGLAEQRQRAGYADADALQRAGGQQYQMDQQARDFDYDEFRRRLDFADRPLDLRLRAMSGQPLQMYGGQTATTTTRTPTDWGGLLNAGASLASMFAFSDRRLKRDATRTDKMTPRGVPIWRFSYLWDPPGTVREGVMADQAPADAVATGPGGFEMVDYGRL